MIKIYKNSVQQPKLKKLKDFQPTCWASVVSPNDKEIELLSNKLGLPVDVIEDSLDDYELSRVKVQNDNIIIILRVVEQKDGNYFTSPFTIIINKQYTVTVATKNLSFLNEFSKQTTKISTTQQSNFFIKLSLKIIERYQSYITTINRDVQSAKSEIRHIAQSDIVNLIETEEILNDFIASLTPTINTIKKILNYSYIDLYSSDKELIDDLLVDGEQVKELCITNLKTIRNIRDGYTTILTINLNQVIKILTYITVFFTIPMIVASIYGMNIRLPYEDSPYALLIISIATVVLSLAAVAFFVAMRKKL